MYEALVKIGLSDKEAKIYLATLKLGSAPAAKIAQSAQLNRPTTYVVLEKLAQMGLVTVFDKGKIQYFTAEDPEQLFRMAEAEKRLLEKKVLDLKEKLPEFKALFARADRPRVLLYDSSSSADEYFYSHLKQGEQVYGFTDFDALSRWGGDKDEPNLRLKHNISTSVIYTRDAGSIENASSKDEKREAKFVTREDFPFKSIITMAPESGLIFLKDPETNTAVFIENKLLAQSVKAIFSLLWNKI